MKAIVSYYSYTGHAEKIAENFGNALKLRGEVRVQKLKPKDDLTSFFTQCKAAFMHQRAELTNGIVFDVAPYDLIVIGSPIWAFAPTPAINTYLDNLKGLSGKRAIVFLTSGSGAGVKKCFEIIKSALEGKGISKVVELNISDTKFRDEKFIASAVENIISEALK